MASKPITLTSARTGDLPVFKRELQEAFEIAFIEEFGPLTNGPIPSDGDLDSSFATSGAEILHVCCDGRNVGGAVVIIDEKTNCNSLHLFFIRVSEHGRGLGSKAWAAIEARYPETLTWQLHTPYFEKRNIHFYVNKCGFKIIEFFNSHHADPHRLGKDNQPDTGEAFLFEKIM